MESKCEVIQEKENSEYFTCLFEKNTIPETIPLEIVNQMQEDVIPTSQNNQIEDHNYYKICSSSLLKKQSKNRSTHNTRQEIIKRVDIEPRKQIHTKLSQNKNISETIDPMYKKISTYQFCKKSLGKKVSSAKKQSMVKSLDNGSVREEVSNSIGKYSNIYAGDF